MIDSTIATSIPAIFTAMLAYAISSKKSSFQNAKLLADVQTKAIEQVRVAEEKMRNEVWIELNKVRQDNEELREEMRQQGNEIHNLKNQLEQAAQLRLSLTEQVRSLEYLVETYKERIIELENKKVNNRTVL